MAWDYHVGQAAWPHWPRTSVNPRRRRLRTGERGQPCRRSLHVCACARRRRPAVGGRGTRPFMRAQVTQRVQAQRARARARARQRRATRLAAVADAYTRRRATASGPGELRAAGSQGAIGEGERERARVPAERVKPQARPVALAVRHAQRVSARAASARLARLAPRGCQFCLVLTSIKNVKIKNRREISTRCSVKSSSILLFMCSCVEES